MKMKSMFSVFLQMIENVTKKPNSHARQTKPGTELSAYPKNGFATATPIASMEPTKIPPYIPARRLLPAYPSNSLAGTAVASIPDGCAITITTAGTEQMRENSAIPNTKIALRRNSVAKISNASDPFTVAMEKTTAGIIRTKWDAIKRILLARQGSSDVTTENALIIGWFVTKCLTAPMTATNRCTAM